MNTSRTDPTIRLLVLVGPTASGKTTLGVEVAHALRSEIVSADSRQVYRGLDIGSGKDLETYASVAPPVPYHLIDVADPTDIYSVYHYQRDCYALLESRAPVTPYREGRPLVMVGGTGLLVEAVLRGYRIPHVPENEALREQLMTRSREDLIRELGELDATRLAATDCSTRKRVVRAIEIATYAKDHTLVTSPPPPVRVVAGHLRPRRPPGRVVPQHRHATGSPSRGGDDRGGRGTPRRRSPPGAPAPTGARVPGSCRLPHRGQGARGDGDGSAARDPATRQTPTHLVPGASQTRPRRHLDRSAGPGSTR